MITGGLLSPIERQHQFLNLLARYQRVTIATICKMFSISEAATRRDLEILAIRSVLQRVHGGAISFIGHITEQALSEINSDRFIICIRAISINNELTNDYLPETTIDRAILHGGREVIIVVDLTKCGVISTAFIVQLTSIYTMVTDSLADVEFVDSFLAQGIRVLLT